MDLTEDRGKNCTYSVPTEVRIERGKLHNKAGSEAMHWWP